MKNEKVNSYEKFHYLEGDNDTSKFDITKISEQAGVVLDCKGALWHIIVDKKTEKKELLQLLKNYIELMNDDKAVLLIYGLAT